MLCLSKQKGGKTAQKTYLKRHSDFILNLYINPVVFGVGAPITCISDNIGVNINIYFKKGKSI